MVVRRCDILLIGSNTEIRVLTCLQCGKFNRLGVVFISGGLVKYIYIYRQKTSWLPTCRDECSKFLMDSQL